MNERVSGKPSGLAGRLVVEGIIDADQATRPRPKPAARRYPSFATSSTR
jgi:type IV pilus assembly protein PilB